VPGSERRKGTPDILHLHAKRVRKKNRRSRITLISASWVRHRGGAIAAAGKEKPPAFSGGEKEKATSRSPGRGNR